jgi:phenylacetate-coenzyme A ligase PaaK-like adenylate-forming protein
MTGIAVEAARARMTAEFAARIPEHIQRLDWPAERLAMHQRDRLRALLAHAQEASPFHARRLRFIDPSRVELADLARLPVMTKARMMGTFDEVVTDRRLSRRLVEEHLAASTREPSLLLDEYVCLASGGSSGRRAVFVQRVAEYAEFAATIMRKRLAVAMSGGGVPPDGLVVALVAASSPVHSTGFGAATAAGPVRIVPVPATLPIPEAVERLNALQPPVLIGYPTRLAQLARERVAGRLRIAPRSVSATSELLTADDRATITAAFGVPVIDQFASTEGLVGQSEPGDSVIAFATDTCLVELVDADNRPIGPGRPSAKALVTNLHNLTQPLIRYELTDRFVAEPDGGPWLRARVDGRTDDVFRYGPVEVHPIVVRTVLVKVPEIIEYEVHQTSRGVEVLVVADGWFNDVAVARELEHGLRRAGVAAPEATVRTVKAVPRHPETGKARRFIPLESVGRR